MPRVHTSAAAELLSEAAGVGPDQPKRCSCVGQKLKSGGADSVGKSVNPVSWEEHTLICHEVNIVWCRRRCVRTACCVRASIKQLLTGHVEARVRWAFACRSAHRLARQGGPASKKTREPADPLILVSIARIAWMQRVMFITLRPVNTDICFFLAWQLVNDAKTGWQARLLSLVAYYTNHVL